ncbi:MAG: disulfide bond formation protein B [Chlamydiia bacterium]
MFHSQFFARTAWALSVIAVLSGYFVEYVLNDEPCPLCLYERYLMLSLVVMLFPVWGGHPFFKVMSAINATIGAMVAYDHTVLQETPYETLPAIVKQLPEGYEALTPFMTMPFAAFATFAVILFCLAFSSITDGER